MDLKTWNAPWCNRLYWILDSLQTLNLDPREALVLILIEYFNDQHQPVTHELIAEKTGLSVDVIEDLFAALSEKGYLSILLQKGQLEFVLEGLVSSQASGTAISRSTLEEFETEFGRSFSPDQMQRILDLEARYGHVCLMAALDEASVRGKRSLDYIESVLSMWKRKGLSEEDVKRGLR